MYSIAVFIETLSDQQKRRTIAKKVAFKTLFSFEKKVPLTTLRVQFKPWNIA